MYLATTSDTTTVLLSRWGAVILAVAVLFVAVAACVFTTHRPTRYLIGVGALFALIALGMRVAVLFSGTG